MQPYRDFADFVKRNVSVLNKKRLECMILSGCFDSLGYTRAALMAAYDTILAEEQNHAKRQLSGQMSLFDTAGEEFARTAAAIPARDEFPMMQKLGYEKAMTGIYISGHPLEEQEELWRKGITNTTADFVINEEIGEPAVRDNMPAIIGGIIVDKKIKYTKNDKIMAFLQIEDLVGSVEVIVFPRDYEKNSDKLLEDNKVFVRGRVSLEEERDGKLICEKITAFDEIPKKLWIKFPSKEAYESKSKELLDLLADSDGKDSVIIYIEEIKAMKKLPPNWNVNADEQLAKVLSEKFGKENVKIVWDVKKD